MQNCRGKIIKQSVLDKGIVRLCHFTNIDNIDSILKNGLLSRKELDKNNYAYIYHDKHRADDCIDAISISIMHPNHILFDAFRNKNKSKEWCVIALKTSILWEKSCAFCFKNAASNAVKNILLEERKNPKGFHEMFHEETKVIHIQNITSEQETRKTCNTCSFYPTDPQAEVLCFDVIEPNMIIFVAFNSLYNAEIFQKQYPLIPMQFSEYLFSKRVDCIKKPY